MSFLRSPHARFALRILGAALLLFVGADHYYEYAARDYSVIPTIGTLFLLNFVSATIVGLALLTPLERVSRRFGSALLAVTAASGAGIAATSLLALLVSEQTKLFGFMEYNYRPEVLVAIASEAAAMLVLAALALLAASAARSVAYQATRPRNRPPAACVPHEQTLGAALRTGGTGRRRAEAGSPIDHMYDSV
ncbi:MAG TPA: hypothetical protein VNY27_10300 [Solirubrobacteraceae bacterium]|jgi:hypothetical protein|nr:hypothetical protein [Solirubrobacteraceae bacterium]